MTDELELNDDEMGIDNAFKLKIAMHERMQSIQSAYQLKLKITNQGASSRSNTLLGNQLAARQFEQNVNGMKIQLKHCIDTVKQIDNKFPEALEAMRKEYFQKEVTDDAV